MARKVGGTRLFAYSFCARQFKKTACGLTACVSGYGGQVDEADDAGPAPRGKWPVARRQQPNPLHALLDRTH
ncbi:MAG TPA: hypothetical protein VJ124_24710 [Pyrinomonadaceae bacterium]|nr:hypothetical protein [Pyrinomonadaceae bacterium]